MKKKRFFEPTADKVIFASLPLVFFIAFKLLTFFMSTFYNLKLFHLYTWLDILSLVPSVSILSAVILSLAFYFISPFIAEYKKLLWAIIVIMALGFILSIIYLAYFDIKNNISAYSCNADSDCSFNCPFGSANSKFIKPVSYMEIDCYGSNYAFCENNRCDSIALTQPKTLEDCNKVDMRGYLKLYKPQCYALYGIKSQNPLLCDEFSNLTDKGICYSTIGIAAKNITFCDKVSDSRIKKLCLSQIGSDFGVVFKGNTTLCDNYLKNDFARDFCYGSSAIYLGNISMCSKAESDEAKQWCVNNIRGY